MLKGIHLTLMIGPAVPVPVPREVLDALTSVKVMTKSGGEESGFELKFTLSKNSPLNTLFLLTGGAGIPIVRVILVVTMGGMPQVLIDGVMTHHQVEPGSGQSESSTLTVQGKDLTVLMDFIDFSGIPYPAMPPFARVLLVLAKYAAFGIVPMVIPEIIQDVPVPVDRIPGQQGKDLRYVRQLAMECGYVFYLDPGPAPGMSVAYWGPEIKVGIPQPALNTNMDAHTNVESLNFRYTPHSQTLPVLFIQEPISKVPIPIPIPDINPLAPPLGLVSGIPTQIERITDVAKLSPMSALLRGLANAGNSSDSVTGEGTLDVLRYGRLLKARQLVGVRGAGIAYDGLYYVKSVTHTIRQGEYKQSFTLARNGLISTLPTVPV